jgi:hypothetical protein
MQTTESCSLCEKIVVTLEVEKPITDLSELPRTFDPNTGKYVWKQREFLSYTIVPRSAEGNTARVDLFLCVDEDDLDDIDLVAFAQRLFHEQVIPQWGNIRDAQFGRPSLSSPTELPCWKLRHVVHGGTDA